MLKIKFADQKDGLVEINGNFHCVNESDKVTDTVLLIELVQNTYFSVFDFHVGFEALATHFEKSRLSLALLNPENGFRILLTKSDITIF